MDSSLSPPKGTASTKRKPSDKEGVVSGRGEGELLPINSKILFIGITSILKSRLRLSAMPGASYDP